MNSDAGIEELLEELTEIIEESKPVLGNSQKRQVEVDTVLAILDEIRDIFPDEIKQARIIVRDRQGMIEAAEVEANRILEDAERQADQIASEQEVVRIAQAKADQILDDAMVREREMRMGAEDYADQLFANLETNLDSFLKNVIRCRERLNSNLTE
ncbi:MAG: ATPase [Coriobacteriales bacterium]|nr:ATPase [Coriobacteriales bacterium]